MKISSILNQEIEIRDRNSQIVIDCTDLNPSNYLIKCQREIISVINGKKTNGLSEQEKEYVVSSSLGSILTEEITLPQELGGITLNGAQIAMGLELLSDKVALATK